jgi:Amt family ammonium transporter
VVGEIVGKAGYHFEIVNNGLEAVEAVKAKRFHLILMDCQMPEMDGFQATQRIRALEQENKAGHRGKIPIIALTANAAVHDQNLCLEAGMDAYCSKPIKTEQLLQLITKYLRR